jgi:hypothetical protein
VVGRAVYAAVMITMGLALLLMTRHIYRAPALSARPMDRQAAYRLKENWAEGTQEPI